MGQDVVSTIPTRPPRLIAMSSNSKEHNEAIKNNITLIYFFKVGRDVSKIPQPIFQILNPVFFKIPINN